MPVVAHGKMYKRATFGDLAPSLRSRAGFVIDNQKIDKTYKEEEMKRKEEEVRNHFVKMRMNEQEYRQLEKRWKETTERHLSNYLRKVALQKPVIVKYRNASADDFLSSMLQLKKDLNGISNNFNQAVKKLHILEKIPEFRTWLILNESLQRAVAANIEEIKLRMVQLYDQWLLR